MRGALTSCLMLTFALSACQAVSTAPSGALRAAVKRPAERQVTKASPTPSPSPTPSATPTPSPTPAVPTTAYTGTVRVDASYLLSAGFGTLISNNGGGAIALGAGSLISNNGGGLISDKGVGLVSNNGGGLVSDKGAGYRLASTVSLGTLLPVKGMLVAPVSLSTGAPLGPAVYTDEAGAYEVRVPQDYAENFLVLAAVPAQREDDPILADARLNYRLIVDPKPDAARVIDEDSTLATSYMQSSIVGRLHDALTTDDYSGLLAMIDIHFRKNAAFKTMLVAQLETLRAAAKAAGIDDLAPADQRRMVQRVSDAIQSRLDMQNLKLSSTYYAAWTGPDEPIMPAMTEVLKAIREKTQLKLADDPAYFETQPYMVEANAGASTPFRVLKPADLGRFMVEAYIAKNELGTVAKVEALLMSVDAQTDPTTGLPTVSRIYAAGNAVVAAFVQALMLDTNGAKTQALAAIRDFKP